MQRHNVLSNDELVEIFERGDAPRLPPSPANENRKDWQGDVQRPADTEVAADKIKACASEPANDIGNARRLICRFGDEIRFVRNLGWHHWTGTHWQLEGGEERAKKLAQATGELIELEPRYLRHVSSLGAKIEQGQASKAEAASLSRRRDRTPEEEKCLADLERKIDEGAWAEEKLEGLKERRARFAVGSGNKNRLNAMLDCATPDLTITPAELDANPTLFNVENGTLEFFQAVDPECPDPDTDRRHWAVKLRPPERTDLITKAAPVVYDPEADCPKFRRFLEMVQPKKDVRSFLQAYCGYALTGLIDEQCFLLNVGGGANGKSTFLEAIGRVMGPYSKTVGFDSVAGDGGGFANGSQATPDLARLRGARLARASEPEHGRQLKEGLIKSITGGEPIIARNLHRDFFEFTPQFKLVLSANQRLELSGVDHGIWRRMRLVPWEVTIPKDQQRRFDEVMEEFWEERSGILNWLVSGALDYLNDGLSAPNSVTHATEEYRKDKDPVGNFASECLERNSESEVPARRMYEAFGAWCALNSVRPWSERAFAEVMLQKGHQKRRSKEGIRYIGVDLLTVADSCTAPHPSEDVVPI